LRWTDAEDHVQNTRLFERKGQYEAETNMRSFVRSCHSRHFKLFRPYPLYLLSCDNGNCFTFLYNTL